ncbi:MliC family protein [Grimontia sp. NTOU-MAR1]|uniref:MliC family protein n=1 Tax=Grimontia sp. NTOU-MAR1 TaxID=3111011 RepID=UPI002DB6032A|nr:MliC family protein [Grimontia sp. NTOU-MAR1]WRV99447.1 MliC family protein [Grimontia sp. NTOU-MAR1]
MNRLLSVAMSTYLLLACTSSLPYQYACEGDQTFGAMVTSDYALVHVNDAEYQLPRIRSASGAQYELEDSSVGLYTKGDDAMLVVGDLLLRECTLSR